MVIEQRTRPLNGYKILVVEDEYYLAADLARALSDAGAEVVGPLGTLEEASARVTQGGFDCAVLDMNLRGSVAHSVALALKDRNVPFLIATGYDNGSLPESLRYAPRVEKPFPPEEVIARVANLCGECA